MSMLKRHNVTSSYSGQRVDIEDCVNIAEERKIHSSAWFTQQGMHVKILRWTIQKCQERLAQAISFLFAICILSTTIDKYLSTPILILPVHPQVVGFNPDNSFYEVAPTTVNYVHQSRKVEPLSEVEVKRGRTKRGRPPREFEEGDCKAMHPWQVEYNMNCNSIHEIDQFSFEYIGGGAYRDVWWMRDGDGSDAVAKTLLWEKRFHDTKKKMHQIDANIYAALQSSVHIPNIYGYCINTGVFDYSKAGNLNDMIDDKDKEIMSKWTSEDILRYAWQATKAVADVHSVGNIHNSAAIAHTDVHPHQFLLMDGMLKLNDFNRARFIRWNSVKEEACPFFISGNAGRHRSPEEYRDGTPLTEQIDVFSLGNILYSILLGEDVFQDVERSRVPKLVMRGKVPRIPREKYEKFDEKERAVEHAIRMCHVEDFRERSTSMEVEEYLRKKLEELDVSKF